MMNAKQLPAHIRVLSTMGQGDIHHPAGQMIVSMVHGDHWVTMRTFDCMSDDHAYTNARDYAWKLAEEYPE
jgi:hypothetical protein